MSVEEAWGLTQAEDDNPDGWNRKKDTILADLKDKLSNCAPLQLLEKTYPDMEQYARLLWKLFPPMPSHPPYMRADLPSQQVESLTGADVHVIMHIATISFSAESMVCEPTIEKILKLADEILTKGFVTDTELSFSTSLRRTWSSRAWKAFRNGVRWLMGLHLSTHSMCAITSPQHA